LDARKNHPYELPTPKLMCHAPTRSRHRARWRELPRRSSLKRQSPCCERCIQGRGGGRTRAHAAVTTHAERPGRTNVCATSVAGFGIVGFPWSTRRRLRSHHTPRGVVRSWVVSPDEQRRGTSRAQLPPSTGRPLQSALRRRHPRAHGRCRQRTPARDVAHLETRGRSQAERSSSRTRCGGAGGGRMTQPNVNREVSAKVGQFTVATDTRRPQSTVRRTAAGLR
jgi:hypothetical protein